MMIYNLTTLSRTDILHDNGMKDIWNYLHYVFLARGLVRYYMFDTSTPGGCFDVFFDVFFK